MSTLFKGLKEDLIPIDLYLTAIEKYQLHKYTMLGLILSFTAVVLSILGFENVVKYLELFLDFLKSVMSTLMKCI
jgi:hypothetical protein